MHNSIGEFLSLLIVWATYFIASINLSGWTSSLVKDTIFECQPFRHNQNISQVSRCANVTESQSCYPGLFPLSGDYTFTVCPVESDQWLPLLYLCIILTSLLATSILSIHIMDYLSDQLNRFRISLFLNKCFFKFPLLWKNQDKDFQEDVTSYLEGKLGYDEEKLSNLLKSAINNGGFLSLIRVTTKIYLF